MAISKFANCKRLPGRVSKKKMAQTEIDLRNQALAADLRSGAMLSTLKLARDELSGGGIQADGKATGVTCHGGLPSGDLMVSNGI